MSTWKCKCGAINTGDKVYCPSCGGAADEGTPVNETVEGNATVQYSSNSINNNAIGMYDVSCTCYWADKLRSWAKGIIIVCWIAAALMFIGMIATAVNMGESKKSSRRYSYSSYDDYDDKSDEITGTVIFTYIIMQCIYIFLCVMGGYVLKTILYSFSIVVENAYLSIRKKE